MTNPALFCPECGVYFTKHFVESPTCCFTLLDEVLNGVHEFGWMPKDQSPRGVASRGSKETPAFASYLQ